MKNKIILASFILLSSLVGKAQSRSEDTDNRDKLQFGLKAGLNYSNVYDASGEEFKALPKFGVAGGLVLKVPFGKYMGIQLEALISQKGFRANGSILGSNYGMTRTSTFMDIPLMFQLKPSEFFTIVVGPQFSYLLNQHDVFTSSATSYVQETQFQQDNIRKNILGFTGGFDINLRHINLGARVGCDFQNNNSDGSATTPRYKNMWFQGTVGYMLYGNHKN
jgi:Outer membrane protein beta-barrel domain